MLDLALEEAPKENGMRWAGLRISTFTGELTCSYFVWSDADPEASCVRVSYHGPAECEAMADTFVASVMPSLPSDEQDSVNDQAPIKSSDPMPSQFQ